MSIASAFAREVLIVIVGIVVTVYFYNTMKREAAAWEAAGTVSSRGIKFVAASSLVWSASLRGD